MPPRRGAARNDANAITANPLWGSLRYVSNAEKGKVLGRSRMDGATIGQAPVTLGTPYLTIPLLVPDTPKTFYVC